ncbi:hypothetical protein MLD38_023463 [Melastoma candidum]|uniref:Uncharacterized protein n=1 Tax=Melastoma candidum TaxID=119954 RepID=A0ACB9NPK4_9MYRT|nr:hypothetical protein MLD38_023463 [Melastoma candidum]
MSKPQEVHRPLFPFGNPFRSISPKGSQLPQKLSLALNDFEESLARRLRALEPKVADDVLTFSWLILAMNSLCETHKDVKNLIAALELPVCDWEDKWIDVYLDISVKLLDICIAFSSELSRLNHGRLLVQCGLYNLESHSPKQFIRARSSLDGWMNQTTSKNPRIENCCSLLDSLMGSLDLPKVKNSSKGNVLMRAMYGVKVQTVLCLQRVPCCPIWIYQEIVELEVDGVNAGEEGGFSQTVAQLSKSIETLSQGLDLLTNGVDSFFQTVLAGRDALLCNLRANSTASDLKPWCTPSLQERIILFWTLRKKERKQSSSSSQPNPTPRAISCQNNLLPIILIA